MLDWIKNTLANQVSAAFLGGLLTMLAGIFAARWALFRDRSHLRRGEFHGQLLVQSHALLGDGDGHEVLCFTTERIYPDISEIFPNPALAKLFLERARQTTKTNPLIDLSDQGEHAKRTIVSHLSASVEGLTGEYVVLITREVQDAVERRMNRVFLIQLPLLQRLRDWKQVVPLRVEQAPHWPRLLNLHYAASTILDDDDCLREDQQAFYARIVFGPRIALDSLPVDWQAHGFKSPADDKPLPRHD